METIKINGTLLRVLIQELGTTQKEVAEAVGISENAMTAWIWGESSPKINNYLTLCEVLDVSPKLLAISSSELVERSRTNRVMRFHARELLGKNEPPDYRETRDILQDLNAEADRDAGEEEVRQEDLTVFGEDESHPDPESDAETGDEESSSGDNG